MKSPKKKEKKQEVHRHKWFDSDGSCPCCGFEEQYCLEDGCHAFRSRELGCKWVVQD